MILYPGEVASEERFYEDTFFFNFKINTPYKTYCLSNLFLHLFIIYM